MFEGRILQCSQGHSVCEACVQKISRINNECPQCRGAFVGTRNYILEEMVKQLKHLQTSAMVKKKQPAAAGTSDANANAVANGLDDSDDTNVVDDAKLYKAIATLVASIPKPSKHEPATTRPIGDYPILRPPSETGSVVFGELLLNFFLSSTKSSTKVRNTDFP